MNIEVEMPSWVEDLISDRVSEQEAIRSLDVSLHDPDERDLNRTIYLSLMRPWFKDRYGNNTDAAKYGLLFHDVHIIYHRVVNDSHPELKLQFYVDCILEYCKNIGYPALSPMILSIFYIYLRLRTHKEWEVNLMVDEMKNRVQASLEERKEYKEDEYELLTKAEQIIAETLQKRSEEPAPKAIVEVPQAVKTEAPQAVSEEEAKEEEVKGQLTNSQLVLLFQSILNLNLLATNRNALSRLIAAVSGRSADSIRQHTKREINYDSEKVKQDVEVVANLLNELAPAIARRMRNDIADPPIQDPPQ